MKRMLEQPLRERLRDELVAEGQSLLRRPRRVVPFTDDEAVNALLNDLDGHPHAFLFGCIVDRQVPAERAWALPYAVKERLGTFDWSSLQSLTLQEWIAVLREPTPLHRLPETMALVLHRACERLDGLYYGDAAAIWRGGPSSATVVRRLLEFHGIGPKLASMTANILVREFHVPLSDYRYIDISADVHVRRVMARLGLVELGSDTDVVIWAAREMHPDFPGIFDLPLWQIGRSVCTGRRAPACSSCRLEAWCEYSASVRAGVEGPPPTNG